jgi:hypothetical protein
MYGRSKVEQVKNQHPAHTTGARREKLESPSYDLVPYQEITAAFVPVAEHGARKYSPWNWVKGLPRRQILSSMARHVFARLRGEMVDPDSGLPHSYHILWNATALVHHEMHGLGAAPDEEVRVDETYVVDRTMAALDTTSEVGEEAQDDGA